MIRKIQQLELRKINSISIKSTCESGQNINKKIASYLVIADVLTTILPDLPMSGYVA